MLRYLNFYLLALKKTQLFLPLDWAIERSARRRISQSVAMTEFFFFIRITVPWGEWSAGVRHARRRGGGRRWREAAAHVAGLRRVAGVGLLDAQLARAARHPRDHRMNTAVRWPTRVTLGCRRPCSGRVGPRVRPWLPFTCYPMNSHCHQVQGRRLRELISEVGDNTPASVVRSCCSPMITS